MVSFLREPKRKPQDPNIFKRSGGTMGVRLAGPTALTPYLNGTTSSAAPLRTTGLNMNGLFWSSFLLRCRARESKPNVKQEPFNL